MRTASVILLLLMGTSIRTEAPEIDGHGSIEITECDLFDQAMELIKRYEGLHTEKDYPYVGYGHRMLPGETFGEQITEQTADSLLRADLKRKCAVFRGFGRDSLLLGVLAYNIGEYRLLGNGVLPKSRLIGKLEAGERDIREEYTSYRKWQGRIVPALERRRVEEYDLLYGKTQIIFRYENDDSAR